MQETLQHFFLPKYCYLKGFCFARGVQGVLYSAAGFLSMCGHDTGFAGGFVSGCRI